MRAGGISGTVRCRRVRLWGADVWLDDSTGRVWCGGCGSLVDVDDLADLDNGHRVGLPNRSAGRLLPIADDETVTTPPAPWDLEW